MDIQHIILGIIGTHPKTGYEIKQFFDKSLTFFSGASYGSIYPTLKALDKKGYVTVELEIQDGKPNRKIYTITEKGRTAFQESLLSPLKPLKPKYDLLTRLFFFADVPQEKRLLLIEEQLDMLQQKSILLQELEPFVMESGDDFQILCYQFGVEMLSRNIDGIKSIKRKIKNTTGQTK